MPRRSTSKRIAPALRAAFSCARGLAIGAVVLCLHARAQTLSLADPAVAVEADGIVRPSATLRGVAEAWLPIAYPSSHAANLLVLHNGDTLCVWFAGAWEGQSGVGIVMSRLARGADTWSRPQLIDRSEGESYQNPVLFQDGDGVLHLFHTRQPAKGGESEAQVMTAVSRDNGHTWSEPHLLFAKAGAFTRHPLLVLQDGTWLLPLSYITSHGIGEGSETNFSAMELSRDLGATWKECIVPASEGKVQPTVVQIAPHSLVALFRSRAADWIYRSTSEDGCTWTAPERTSLPNNNASVQMTRLRNGHLVLVFNESSAHREGGKVEPGLRKPLCVAISRDGGALRACACRRWRFRRGSWWRLLRSRRQSHATCPWKAP